MPDRTPQRRGLRELAHAMADLRREAAPPTLLAKVQERWSGAVGSSVAAQAMPVSEHDGVVTVACRSAVWASELSMLSETLLESLNGHLAGGRRVRALRFTTRPD